MKIEYKYRNTKGYCKNLYIKRGIKEGIKCLRDCPIKQDCILSVTYDNLTKKTEHKS